MTIMETSSVSAAGPDRQPEADKVLHIDREQLCRFLGRQLDGPDLDHSDKNVNVPGFEGCDEGAVRDDASAYWEELNTGRYLIDALEYDQDKRDAKGLPGVSFS